MARPLTKGASPLASVKPSTSASINLKHGVFIAIAGNIGSGKSTLTAKLAQALDITTHFESVEDNPYLEDFYADMERWAFPVQIYFLNHRFRTHQEIVESGISAIQDRSIYEDAHIFAKVLHDDGKLETRDYLNYLALFESMSQYLKVPSLLIGLKRSLPRLEERIRERGREFERSIDPHYLAKLNHYYDDWFQQYDLGPSLIVETDQADFLRSDEDFAALKSSVVEAITQGHAARPPQKKSLKKEGRDWRQYHNAHF